jgi:hypothetical protein
MTIQTLYLETSRNEIYIFDKMDPIYNEYDPVTMSPMPSGYTTVFDLSLPDPPSSGSIAQPIPKTRKAPRKTSARTRTHLTDEDHLVILRLCNRDSEKYGRVTNKRFWKEIAREFKETTGKEHDSLWRVVDSIIKKRREFLEDLESGTQDLTDEKTIQTDTWISTLDAYKVQKNADEEERGRLDEENEATKNHRLQALDLWTNRQRLAMSIPEARLPASEDGDNGEEEGDGEEGEENSVLSRSQSQSSSRRPKKRRREERSISPGGKALIGILGRLVDVVANVTKPDQRGNETGTEQDNEVDKRLKNLEGGVSRILALLERGERRE